jgi:hypothetical protein
MFKFPMRLIELTYQLLLSLQNFFKKNKTSFQLKFIYLFSDGKIMRNGDEKIEKCFMSIAIKNKNKLQEGTLI